MSAKTTHSYDFEAPTVAIAHARSFTDNSAFLDRHLPLVAELSRHGVSTVALNGAKDRTEDSGVFSTHHLMNPGGDMVERHGLLKVDAGYDITGGLARYTDVRSLNPLAVREIALSKQLQHDVLRGELGEAVPSTVTASAELTAVIAALDTVEADEVIVKAEGDVNKKFGALSGPKADVRRELDGYLSAMDSAKDKVIIQELMPEVAAQFAAGINYFDASEKEAADSLEDSHRELRVHTIDGTPLYVTGRAGLDATKRSPMDQWIYLDQASVPAYVTDLASKAATLIKLHANSPDAYLAVDLTPDGSRIVEVNGRNIGTMRREFDRPGSNEAQKVTTAALANKLASMAREERGA